MAKGKAATGAKKGGSAGRKGGSAARKVEAPREEELQSPGEEEFDTPQEEVEQEGAEGAEEVEQGASGSATQPKKSKAANLTKKNTGLVFDCYKMRRRMLASRVGRRIKPEAAVYMAAVLEYLAAEVMEIAGDAAKQMKKRRILPRHLKVAVDGDPEIAKLFEDANVVIPGAGVTPGIHAVLARAGARGAFTGWSRQDLSVPGQHAMKG